MKNKTNDELKAIVAGDKAALDAYVSAAVNNYTMPTDNLEELYSSFSLSEKRN